MENVRRCSWKFHSLKTIYCSRIRSPASGASNGFSIRVNICHHLPEKTKSSLINPASMSASDSLQIAIPGKRNFLAKKVNSVFSIYVCSAQLSADFRMRADVS